MAGSDRGPRRRGATPGLPPAPVAIDTGETARDALLRSWPGRLFLLSAALKVLVALWRLAMPLPAAGEVLGTVATIGILVALGYFVVRLFVLIKRRLLWRVRRKLILSYIFIGVIPSLLILVFFLFSGSLIFMNVCAYLFKGGYDKVVEDARVVAVAAATEIARNPDTASQTVNRVYRIRSRPPGGYPNLSIAYIAPDGSEPTAGPWEHMAPPRLQPGWLKTEIFAGTIALAPADAAGEPQLVVRAAAMVGPGGTGGLVVADIPVDDQLIQRIHDTTGVRVGAMTLDPNRPERLLGGGAADRAARDGGGVSLLLGHSVTQLDYTQWTTGAARRATLSLTYRVGELYRQVSSAQGFLVGGMRLGDAFLLLLVAVAILFLIIEAAALVMGLALARSITSAVHELFMGTERVRQGDFTHRIHVRARDQLGELAGSFNEMTGSIENLLQTAAEKKRLEEELRIARQIQMSLLPRGPLEFAGLAVTALCVPAREVGGDYYDFFPLGGRRLGVLIADVSGKGTSAALYMAELKGLVLSLSQISQSPRQLLLDVNRIIAENLDTRSFITMTYAVIDLEAGVMTFARAGHTPLIYLAGPSAREPAVRVLVPSGMVVGLRLPGAGDKFAELLEEHRVPLHEGDVIVLYTDGITEAMNQASDLFGESRLSRLVEEHGHLDSSELRERILREIEAFVGSADQHDDMTMIILKVEEALAARQAVAV
ncbi:MAG TPA: SpoIIE family protein phosphatase [Vicinamibacterales bacterium]|nr:SpoIIE family protein phosphatase [Vicinamibacterales bacterium]